MVQIDARGMRCPWPAIRLARALREHPGEAIEILADDPNAERELTQLATAAGMTIAAPDTVQKYAFRLQP